VIDVTLQPSRFARADAILRAALGVRCTAAVLRVEHRGRALLEQAYGAVDDGADASPVDGSTRFDLASLTKVLVATAVLRAVEEHRLPMDAPLTDLLPEWRETAHEPVTLRMLLAHTSGMQSGADYRQLLGESVEGFALTRTLAANPGDHVIYSDLGFIALGVLLERAHRRSLSAVMAQMCRDAGATHTTYRPAAAEKAAIPATEDDGWRGRVRGIVHDEKAYLMGGVAGHAGLFGTAFDVARFAEIYLARFAGRETSALAASLALEATSEAADDPILRRGLGWALKTSDENSCGVRMARSTFGHTGFTGTCLWADPTRDLSIVLLTNAVYFGRIDIRDLRAAVCDAVVEEIDNC
jgi:CubicO group peptidase (beta-lactamase class C family)